MGTDVQKGPEKRHQVTEAKLRVIAGSCVMLLLATAMSGQKKPGERREDLLAGIPSGKTRVVDLSYSVSEKFPEWPGDKRTFEAKINASVETNGYFTRSFWMLEHFGTHMDAPAHFPPGRATVDEIPAARLFGPAVVIDVQAEGGRNPDYRLGADGVAEWEKRHGRIPEGAIILLRTGWAARVGDGGRYRNQDASGTMHFPGYSVEAVRVLIERKVSGLGIDTMSVDYGASKEFEVHKLSHGAGLYHLENLADLGTLPEAGAFLVVAPIKLEGGSGGACRVFAILP